MRKLEEIPRNEFVNLLTKFIHKNYPDKVKSMKKSDHNYDADNLNPYHLEGDVWTHTMMVVRFAELLDKGNLVILMAYAHDWAKDVTEFRNEESSKVSFFMHEAYSAFLMLDFINSIDFCIISKEEKLRAFLAVSLHTDLYKMTDKNYKKYKVFFKGQKTLVKDLQNISWADTMGRIVDASISNQKESVESMMLLSNKLIDELEDNLGEKDLSGKSAIILTGLPLSGKSTYVKDIVEKYPNFKAVSSDEFLIKVYGDCSEKTFKIADQKLIDRLFNQRIDEINKAGDNIIVDKTNMTRKGRKKLYNRFSSLGYKVHVVCLINDMETIYRRNEERYLATKSSLFDRILNFLKLKKLNKENKYIPKSAIKKMIKTFRPPTLEEADSLEFILSE